MHMVLSATVLTPATPFVAAAFCFCQVFMMHPPIDCAPSDELAVNLTVRRREDNHRLLAVDAEVTVTGASQYAQGEGAVGTRKLRWNVD